jgi:hypothetical protein
MEIVKDKFIETFQKECEKAIENLKADSFRSIGSSDEVGAEIVANEKVSFLVLKMTNNYFGKILLSGFVDYKSIPITEEEFKTLYEFHTECEAKARLAVKNHIITEGEIVLEKLIS